jgi:DedD protein
VAKPPISDEELQLRKRARRRLVGAIALVLLVVVLVPMFLEREPRPLKQDMDIRIPPIPGQSQSPPLPNAPPTGTPGAPAQSGSVTPVEPATAPLAASGSTPALAEAPAPRSTPVAPEPTAPHTALAGQTASANPANPRAADGFVIQLGAYSNAPNAKQLLKQLKAHKVPAYTESVKTPKGERTRVRAGPYPSAEAAEKARERLKALKLIPVSDAKVVRTGE